MIFSNIRFVFAAAALVQGQYLQELAVGKPTKQISDKAYPSDGVWFSGNSSHAVDRGPISGPRQTCARTDRSLEPWWMVDLGGVYMIKQVAITTFPERVNELKNFTITLTEYWDNSTDKTVKTKVCYSTEGKLPSGNRTLLHCYAPVMARYVVITRYNSLPKSLVTCEVEVYGTITEGFFSFTSRPGKRSESRILEVVRGTGLPRCSAHCKRYQDCTSFNVAKASGVCELMADPLADLDSNEVDDSDWTRYIVD